MSTLEIRRDLGKDPDGRRLRELLGAIDRVERLGARRSQAIHALALLGGVLWIGVAFPRLLPDEVRMCALAGFASLVLGAIGVLMLEWRWQRIQSRCMDENDVKVLENEDRHGTR